MKIIKVNGKEILFPNDVISYKEVIELSERKYSDDVVMSITFFAKGPDKWTIHQGIISPGEIVPVWNGMHIECCFTGNA